MDIEIRTSIKPGDLGAITWLHGVIYAEEYGLDESFEPYVAAPLSELLKSDEFEDQRIWIVEKQGTVKGSIAIVRNSPEEAQLRWFILAPELRGMEIGKKLTELALDFCRMHGYKRLFLWTFDELYAAIGIYRKYGFVKTEEISHVHWGRDITEEKYVLNL